MADITLPAPPMTTNPERIAAYLRELHGKLQQVVRDLDRENQTRGDIYRVKAMAKADLPKNSLTKTGDTAYVTDTAGGAQICYYDGTDWREAATRNVVA